MPNEIATLPQSRSPRAMAVLRELPAFLRRPAVLHPAGLGSIAAWQALLALVVFHIVGLLLVVLPIMGLWQSQFELPLPDAFDKLPSGWLVPVTLLAAPVLEEILFRSWQTGRPRALWLLACSLVAGALVVVAPTLEPLATVALLFVLLAVTLTGWWKLRRHQGAPGLFIRLYPAIFWLVAAGFALMHLTNYPSASLISVPMVLPQLWAAALLGFTRQRLGLPAAMLQHAAANTAAISLALLGT